MEPCYLKLYREGRLASRVKEALGRLESCRLCPRQCEVNRIQDELGYCKTGRKAKVASYNAHFGEERPLVGDHGSGTIFMSSCNLLCSFCQNWEISHLGEGLEAEPGHLASMMLELQDRGCHNINFVTPSHVVPQILEGLLPAIENGLHIPLVYNSSGYDRRETLELLDGVFDIYMPDFKFWESKWSERYCEASDYREAATEAIKEMHRQVGDLILSEKGIAQRGLLVRHLVMPNGTAGTESIMAFLADEVSSETYVNVMDQYRPCGRAGEDPYINRRLTAQEYRHAVDSARKAGLSRLEPRDRLPLVFRL